MRGATAEAEASNKRVSVFATTPHNQMQILNKAPDTVVAAVEYKAALEFVCQP